MKKVGNGALLGAILGATAGSVVGVLSGLWILPLMRGLFSAGMGVTVAGFASVILTGIVAGALAGAALGALAALIAVAFEPRQKVATAEATEQPAESRSPNPILPLAVPLGTPQPAEPVVDDARDYLMSHHLPVFGESLEDDYYEDELI